MGLAAEVGVLVVRSLPGPRLGGGWSSQSSSASSRGCIGHASAVGGLRDKASASLLLFPGW